jgi:hypothetical protein
MTSFAIVPIADIGFALVICAGVLIAFIAFDRR